MIELKSNNDRALDCDAILAQLLTTQSERIGDIPNEEAYGEYQSKVTSLVPSEPTTSHSMQTM